MPNVFTSGGLVSTAAVLVLYFGFGLGLGLKNLVLFTSLNRTKDRRTVHASYLNRNIGEIKFKFV